LGSNNFGGGGPALKFKMENLYLRVVDTMVLPQREERRALLAGSEEGPRLNCKGKSLLKVLNTPAYLNVIR
jgi:hypothetical protein